MLDKGVPIDTKYYLENQLSKPLLGIFEPIMGETKAKSLLAGNHTLKVKQKARMDGGLMKFAKKTAKCMGCKATLRKDEKTLCHSCKANESALYQTEVGPAASYCGRRACVAPACGAPASRYCSCLLYGFPMHIHRFPTARVRLAQVPTAS